MKKVTGKSKDELRTEYKRSDFDTFVRGKYAERAAAATNIVVLEPRVARAFPNDRAVNAALRGLMRQRTSPPSRASRRKKRGG